ncbi:MAG: dTDP-4-dehydrorhamnose reductase [Paludibacteraceae bacterium]
MNKILITGSNGQLGSEIRKISSGSENEFFFTDVQELDITDLNAIENFVKENNIDIIVNCAAYTNVDKAEDNFELVDRINHLAVKNLANVSKKQNLTLIHVSTDYVFDGTKNFPYVETDPTAPLGVYGNTKLNGEKAVINSGCDYLIIRTSWLYSSVGNNFVKTMRRLTSENENLKVVFDQVGTPTFAGDLANTILRIIEAKKYKGNSGIYHFSNEGVCSWYDFAVEIRNQFGNVCDVQPCHSDEFSSKVKRPNFSVLDKTKIKQTFDLKIPYWKDSLTECIEILK